MIDQPWAWACLMSIYALAGLHGLCLLVAIYMNLHLGIKCHVEVSRGDKEIVNATRAAGNTSKIKEEKEEARDKDDLTVGGKARPSLPARICSVLCCCMMPLLRLFCGGSRSADDAPGALSDAETMTEDSKGLYLYQHRQDMQEGSLLGGRNSKETASAEAQRLPFMTKDRSLASSWEVTPNARARTAGGDDSDDDGGGVGTDARAMFGFSTEMEVQTDQLSIVAMGSKQTSTEIWSTCDVGVHLDPVVVDARTAHSDLCFAYFYNYPAVGSPFAGPWRCAKNRFYNGVPLQIEFDGSPDEWEPMGYRADLWGRLAYKKVELVALIEEASAIRPPQELARTDAATGDVALVPTGGQYRVHDVAGDVARVCYVCSYNAEDDALIVSRGYSHAAGGHNTGKHWRLLRVPYLFGTPQPRRTNFAGAWQCEQNDFYQGRVVEIEPDGDAHRWHPRGGALANYLKVDLVDLVEMLIDEDPSRRQLSRDDGRAPATIEQHHVASLSRSGHTLTVSRSYNDDGHAGELWTLNRIRDCGGESLQSQLFARTYKYVHASASSAAAYDDATTALQQLQSIEFNGARELATKRSTLGVAQAWSVAHTDHAMSARNAEVLDMVVSILRRYPELVCEVHGTTTTPREMDRDLMDFFFQRGGELGQNFFKLDADNQMERVYACLARERAASCLAALVERGVEAGRLRTTHKACTGESRVHFIARAGFRSRASYDPSDDADYLFAGFDVDSSGSIDVQELRVCLNELGLRTDTKGALALLKRFDEDKSNRLEFAEFKRLIQKLREYYSKLTKRYDPNDATDIVFQAYDADGNGQIDVVELREALMHLRLVTDSIGASQILAKYDASRSGRLEHREFKRLVVELRKFQEAVASGAIEAHTGAPPITAGGTLSVGAVFRSFDKDGSGDIDVSELAPALSALGLSADTAEAVMVLQKYDVDRSGKLTLPEFRVLAKELRAFQAAQEAAAAAPPTPPPAAAPPPAGSESVGGVFRRFDADGSGAIDQAELMQALNALGLQSDAAGTAAVMKKYDQDGNGTLSLPEFRMLVKELRAYQQQS